MPHLLVPGPGGVPFTQAMARRLADEPWLAFACGRYEGIDERVYEHAAERMPVTVVSLGDYVLNGGEVAVLAMVEAVGRLLPGVVGNAESLVEESHEGGLLEYPVYTRPAAWDDGGTVREVPPVLLGGDHAAVARWRHEQRVHRTAARRPDLLAPAATVGALADLEVRPATAADAPELLVLQRACWLREGLAALGRWVVPPLAEELADVVAGLGEWTTWVGRVRGADGSPGRLVASVRARVCPDDASTWEVGRLMVAPDLQGRGLGRELLAFAEAPAPGVGHRLPAHHRGARGGQPALLPAGGLPPGPGRGHPSGQHRPHQAAPLTPAPERERADRSPGARPVSTATAAAPPGGRRGAAAPDRSAARRRRRSWSGRP